MSGLNADRIVPENEIRDHLNRRRWDHGARHKYTARHPANDAELIGPGFNDKAKLAEYYDGVMDGIIYVMKNPSFIEKFKKETK